MKLYITKNKDDVKKLLHMSI